MSNIAIQKQKWIIQNNTSQAFNLLPALNQELIKWLVRQSGILGIVLNDK